MCFSASASFIASGGLAALGGVSFVSAKKKDKVLAVIPIMFSIQQFCEGIQWLYLNSGSSSPVFGYLFLLSLLHFTFPFCCSLGHVTKQLILKPIRNFLQ